MKVNSKVYNPKYRPGVGGNVPEPTGSWRITSPKLRALILEGRHGMLASVT